MPQSIRPLLWLFSLAWLALAQTAWAAPLQNQLREHPSPYLALHGDDPVAWQEWNADTVARAKQENKLLFVSVGYFSCHWCHVMQQESYSDPAIARLLNQHFIPVKVDRELNGALDAALLEFSERMNGIAGWPLNAFVTPDGYPVFSVLYKPPTEFKAMLESLAKHWQDNAGKVQGLARQAAAKPAAKLATTRPNAAAAAQASQAFRAASLAQADHLQGGFGQVSKFPHSPQLALLLEIQAEKPDARLAEFLGLTLDQMARLGLRDHVHGGFFRYTVDPDWHTPHFEKMLYDNAQLALVYHRAATVLGRPAYQALARESLDFLLQALATPDGGFQASTSALDERGREGGAYLWDAKTLRERLSPAEYRLVRRLWGLDQPPPFDLGYLPMENGKTSPREQAQLEAIHARLKAAGRMARVPRDSKLNTGLNGLALSALSLAGKGTPRFEEAARKLHRFIAQQLVVEGRLVKARAGKRVFPEAELDDYAYVTRGLLDYTDSFGDAGARQLADKLARQAWSMFFSDQGWRREAKPLLATLRPEPALTDDATPSASGVLLQASQRLGLQPLGPDLARARAMALPELRLDPFHHPSHAAALRAAFGKPRP
jgi:uncharacterized protein YyaL (SSP411 family)